MPALSVWAIWIVYLNPGRGNQTIYASKWINGFKIKAMIFAKGSLCRSWIPHSYLQRALNNREFISSHNRKARGHSKCKEEFYQALIPLLCNSLNYTLLSCVCFILSAHGALSFQKFLGLHFSSFPFNPWIEWDHWAEAWTSL